MTGRHTLQYAAPFRWDFSNPVKLVVGRGCRKELSELLVDKTLLIVTSKRGRFQLSEDAFLGHILVSNRIHWVDSVKENPGLTDLQTEIDRLHDVKFDAVVAFGGGSALDAGKALNVALARDCRKYSLQELLAGPKHHGSVKPTPLYTVSTTSGTGSEVTPFATVWSHELKKKLSLSGPAVWPTAAFVDSELTDSVPLLMTVSTGLDAINQAAESFWNRNANPITMGYSIRALQLSLEALPKLARGQGGRRERDQMSEASLLAGLAISHTRTALCHSISYPITAHFGVPHGLACAFTMPMVLRRNLEAEDGRFAQAALALTGSSSLDNLVACFDRLHETLQVRERVTCHIPSLEALLALEGEMHTPGRADNNLSGEENLVSILEEAWRLCQ